MPDRLLDVVILAAGQGTRMKSKRSKMLHEVLGRPMIAWSTKLARDLGARDIVVVTGHGAAEVEAILAREGVRFARQGEQLGTGHAFLIGARELAGGADVLVLYGDSPMLALGTLRALLERHRAHGAGLTVLTSELADATGYGRIMRAENGTVERIVEEKAANAEEKTIGEFNSGVYLMDDRSVTLAERIEKTPPAGEYYLTDLVALYRSIGANVDAFKIEDPGEVMGANDRVQLAELERLMRARVNEAHLRGGVTMHDPATTTIEDSVEIAPDVILEAGVILRGATRVETGAHIGAYSVVCDSFVGEDVHVKPHSVLEGARVEAGANVGPFARLRPGAVLEEHAHVGNFVEVKNARLGRGVKAGHLAYLGDADIGEDTNIGAGTITANYDGLNKHKTVIGRGVFVGSNTTLIAPATLGDAAFVAGGSAVTGDVPEGALIVARGQAKIVPGWSARYWSKSQGALKAKGGFLADWLARRASTPSE
ncbi:bifunctional UDP-N-acetylglucosamine diphosphorylase/glucosamine-1-phosphate N-acetyltransferase GlmU [Deinococcus yavapaiensis]|uniref:Bifunctional protein GlmU n=1 Tax=Deinococcus yavapaiensis KR-236 TaxID=694435 RepID=A0A318SG83_9DEIO|nr:bifunctional UDP-N-acetylglucosamine diphosphorylase/glucosamine-1-phosphate N-acetyltransferase GlmU [Deinococcus yavapaiensis]PYE53061.1 UDP-N-acetylglucosamine pyrophosphorylase /glucosamine-1-phosphate N-acetyltransferase [Deinococcus yavapaiensis KR-236]